MLSIIWLGPFLDSLSATLGQNECSVEKKLLLPSQNKTLYRPTLQPIDQLPNLLNLISQQGPHRF